MGPTGVFAQSNRAMSFPMSPLAARLSRMAEKDRFFIGATSIFDSPADFSYHARGVLGPGLVDEHALRRGKRWTTFKVHAPLPIVTENRLVYSTDPALNVKCPKCKELKSACRCPKEPILGSRNFVANLRIEKKGRGGKTVTIVDGLPKINIFLKDLTKQLKNACGSGGTFSLEGKEGLIEIQGDKRDMIREFLTKKGIKTKG